LRGCAALVLVLETLILELLTVDHLASGTVAFGEIPALSHEATDDAVEFRASVDENLLYLYFGRIIPHVHSCY
jgi:hypothetical protein